MASYTTSNPGNLAIEQHVWTLTIPEAKAVLPLLYTEIGSYWESNLLKPVRRAVRAKAATVTVYTGAFSSSELSNCLYASGATINKSPTGRSPAPHTT